MVRITAMGFENMPEHKKDDTCGNCQFMDDQSETAMKHKKNDSGLCRYNPPTARPEADALGLWPVVGMEDWCGHFAVKVEFVTVGSATDGPQTDMPSTAPRMAPNNAAMSADEGASLHGTSCSYVHLRMTAEEWLEFLGDLRRTAGHAGS
jgi:hypothetical protein